MMQDDGASRAPMVDEEYRKMFRFEEGYWWYRGLHELVLSVLARRLSPGARVLDAGCGTGRMLELLQERYDAEGLDYAPEAVACCRERGVRAVQGDLNGWEGVPGSLDAIVSFDVLCTRGIADPVRVQKAWARSLRPGGWLVLNHPAFRLLRRDHDVAVAGLRRYRKRQVREELERLGYDVEQMAYRLPHLFIFILLQKIGQKLRPGRVVTSDLKELPAWLNRLMLGLNRLENLWVRRGWDLGFGSSLLVVARRRPQI